jgi:hypothetical protein
LSFLSLSLGFSFTRIRLLRTSNIANWKEIKGKKKGAKRRKCNIKAFTATIKGRGAEARNRGAVNGGARPKLGSEEHGGA